LPEELEDYRKFTLTIADRGAAAKEEGNQPVSDAEQTALDEVGRAHGRVGR
jgi:hypothetical protein